MNENLEKLRLFILDYLDNLENSGGGGSGFDIPKYDLYAQDYLAFAEQELAALQNANSQREKAGKLIKFVSHLKQAMDSQLVIFLQVYNIEQFFSKRNLGFDKRLDFLEEVGLFSSRSLRRFNTLRNRMEHQFEIPVLEDVEIYYDLVLAFVSILQSAIVAMYTSSEIEMQIFDLAEEDRKIDQNETGYFHIRYHVVEPTVEVFWSIHNKKEQLVSDMSNPLEFAFFMKVLFLLQRRFSFASNEYIKSQLSC